MQQPSSTLRRRLAGVAALLTLTSTLFLAGTTSAGAAAGDPPQTQGLANICLYQHPNFNDWAWGAKSRCFSAGDNVPADFNDLASSIDNRGPLTGAWCLYEHGNYQGYYFVIAKNSRLANLLYDAAPDGGNWNDRISSLRPLGSGC